MRSDLTATVSVVERGPVFIQVAPPSREYDHETTGVGSPVAPDEKLTVDPIAARDADAGLAVMTGAIRGVTVSVAGLLVALPAALLTMASYSQPFIDVVAERRNFVAVPPGSGAQCTPPSVETDHCTLPEEALTVKETLALASTV